MQLWLRVLAALILLAAIGSACGSEPSLPAAVSDAPPEQTHEQVGELTPAPEHQSDQAGGQPQPSVARPTSADRGDAGRAVAAAVLERVTEVEPQAALASLTVTADQIGQRLWPAFNSAVDSYTVLVDGDAARGGITAAAKDGGGVAYQNAAGAALNDADAEADGLQLDLPQVGAARIRVVASRGEHRHVYSLSIVRQAAIAADPPCAEQRANGNGPTPVALAVTQLPIVVESTTEEYFVLYARREADGADAIEIPVSVTLGAAGATRLAEQLPALPAERYRVERYRISEPADIDGDCIDDVTELLDPVGMNPLNPGPRIELSDGAAALPDRAAFAALSYHQAGAPQGSESVKFVLLDLAGDRPRAYFMNGETHRYHEDFRAAFGLADDLSGMLSGTVIYHPNVTAHDGSRADYHFEFWPYAVYPLELVEHALTVLAASMPLIEGNLAYYMPAAAIPTWRREREMYDQSRVRVLFDEDITRARAFVALNSAESYGFLQTATPGERPNPRDVVIYEALPNELPRVAGIITTVPQTPLSHVNLRAVQDGIPNAFIRGALDNAEIRALIGSYVRYAVTPGGWTLRAATRAEVDEYYASHRPTEPQIPQRDLSVTAITPLDEIGFDDWDAFGAKAANLAVLRRLDLPQGTVPDGFAVPFYFYDEFMRFNGFYPMIESMLDDTEFRANLSTQEARLARLRSAIRDGQMPNWMTDALTALQQSFPSDTPIRCRSSTNNEDLTGFSGAGLYDSRTQHPDEGHIAKCVKQVYASLWNFRAFAERDFHRIDHLAAAMAVLMHPNYANERANGVAVTADPLYGNAATYYINTQVGENLVTNPQALSASEEILLRPNGGYRVVATSNQMPPGELIMSDEQLAQLRDHLSHIHETFAALYKVPPGDRFAMEIEFKITSSGALVIKQARPWLFGS